MGEQKTRTLAYVTSERVLGGSKKWLKIDVGGPKIANISGKSRFVVHPFFHRFLKHQKNPKNVETKDARPGSSERVGGLAEAAGKVRKGNPSGTGRLNASV